MALKIRLRQQGRNNRPFYRLVVADERSPRDGKFIETIGWYNPFETEQEKHMSIKVDRIQHWLDNGAQLTDAAEVIVKKLAPQMLTRQVEKLLKKKAKFAEKRRARRQAAKAAQKK